MKTLNKYGFYLNGELLLKSVICSSIKKAKAKLDFNYPENTNIEIKIMIKDFKIEKQINLDKLNQMGFYKPFKDNTTKIDLMRYCNNNLSYGYNIENDMFYLCESPTLESTIIKIISEHKTFEELKDMFFEYRLKNA